MKKTFNQYHTYMRHVYILYCADDTYYTGITTDLERRISEHNAGLKGAKYTRARQPVELMWSQSCETRSLAMQTEYRIKQLPRDQKISLIQGGFSL